MNNRKLPNSWKHNNSLLNEKWVKTEIKKKIETFLLLNENKYTIYPNEREKRKSGKFIEHRANIRKTERNIT